MTEQAHVGRFRYRFVVVGRHRARTRGNDPHLTLNLLASSDDALVFCGTLTMSEAECADLRGHLLNSLGDAFEVVDRASAPRSA